MRGTKLTPKVVEEYVNSQITDALTPPTPFQIGKSYIFRTITMCNVGRVSNIVGKFVILDQGAWIPDTGRWSECLRDPKNIKEIEPFKKPYGVNVDSIVDYTEWEWETNLEAK